MGYAFISYCTKNQASADALKLILEKNRIRSWMAPNDIPIGSKYAQVISKAIKDCACFILLLTEDSQNSVWVSKEVERAINYRKVIFPLQLEDLLLNDEFELYISTDQIVAIPKIAESEIMDQILASIIVHTGQDESQDNEPAADENISFRNEKKVEELFISKLLDETLEDLILDGIDDKDSDIFESGKKSNTLDKEECEENDFSEKLKNYHFPETEILNKDEEIRSESIDEELAYCANRLLEVFKAFNIGISVKSAYRGPRITTYVVVPNRGAKVQTICNLENDIALALSAESIRIQCPIPGKNAIGIEIPNKTKSIVHLRSLLEEDEFKKAESKTKICIGKNAEGESVFSDIKLLPHLLIAGATGMGKSVCFNTIITSLLYKSKPDEVKFILIDPKRVEFTPYSGLPHLLVPVITDAKKAAAALMWAVDEMERRYDLLEKSSTYNIDQYNAMVVDLPVACPTIPKIVICIDELNDLMIQKRDPIENLIMSLAQKSRAAGIHLIIGTQRPSCDVITGVIKANIPSRIAFKVNSVVDSRIIIDQSGAEKLIGNGDMLFSAIGSLSCLRIQGAYISEKEIDEVVSFVKSQFGGTCYDKGALKDIDTAIEKLEAYGKRDNYETEYSPNDYLQDKKFLSAVEITLLNGQTSVSYLQRKLSIGYGKAAKFIDFMEELGIIGERNGTKAREAKITLQQWQEILKNNKN